MFRRKRKRRYDHTIDARRPAITKDADLCVLKWMCTMLRFLANELAAYCRKNGET